MRYGILKNTSKSHTNEFSTLSFYQVIFFMINLSYLRMIYLSSMGAGMSSPGATSLSWRAPPWGLIMGFRLWPEPNKQPACQATVKTPALCLSKNNSPPPHPPNLSLCTSLFLLPPCLYSSQYPHYILLFPVISYFPHHTLST